MSDTEFKIAVVCLLACNAVMGFLVVWSLEEIRKQMKGRVDG